MAVRFALAALLHGSVALGAKPEFSDVFIASKDGYKSIRIPSVVAKKKGVVLAFAEGRAGDRVYEIDRRLLQSFAWLVNKLRP